MTRATEIRLATRLRTCSDNRETEDVDGNASDQLGRFGGHIVHHVIAVQVGVGHGAEQTNQNVSNEGQQAREPNHSIDRHVCLLGVDPRRYLFDS